MVIVVKESRRYIQSIENNKVKNKTYIRLRQLCLLEKCNYKSIQGQYCKKHTIKETEQICTNCLSVHLKHEFENEQINCKKCQVYISRQSPEFKSFIIIKNGTRYKTFPSGTRKICKIETCERPSSGNFCRKHKQQKLKTNEKQCHRCLTVKHNSYFIENNTEYENCDNCRKYKRIQSLERHHSRRKFLLQLKINMGGKCIDCNTNDLEILEFDHVGDKVTEIKKIWNYQGMLDEAEQCVLRCCNCHIIKTKDTVIKQTIDETKSGRLEYYRVYRERARQYVENLKINSNGCEECGWFNKNYLQVLHFDHLDLDNKDNDISRLVSTGVALKRIQLEIDKCRLLCGNCHRKHTLRQFNYPVLELINNIAN